MKITLICNCGLVFSSQGQTLLIDALTQKLPPFYALPEKTRQEILDGKGRYQSVCGMLFTHLHPDHFDPVAAEQFATQNKKALTYIPSRRTPAPDILHAGCFTVEMHRTRHTPVPGYGKSTVDTMIVSAEGKCVYVASDCAPEALLHERTLGGRVMDAAFWNGEMLLYKPEREMLRACAVQNYIYHIPEDANDGLRRKLERLMLRYPQELANVTLLCAYPKTMIL